MEWVSLVIAGFAGLLANAIADSLKKWLLKKRAERLAQSASVLLEVISPTGKKVELSVKSEGDLDPVAIKKGILLNMLKDPKYAFREFATLKTAIACDEEETKNLLLQIGARHNIKAGGADTWTLQM